MLFQNSKKKRIYQTLDEQGKFWMKLQEGKFAVVQDWSKDAERLRQQILLTVTKWVREKERERERDDWWGKDSHHPARAPQWSVEAAVVCWGQVCGAVELEQYSSTGGPDPNQPRNVEEEALGTMCSVPMPFWVPPASALFCFQAEENRKTNGLGPRSHSLFHSQLRRGLVSTQSA